MASELDQFADLELSKEDREQIFDPPLDRQQLEGAGTSRYLCNSLFFFKYKSPSILPLPYPNPPLPNKTFSQSFSTKPKQETKNEIEITNTFWPPLSLSPVPPTYNKLFVRIIDHSICSCLL